MNRLTTLLTTLGLGAGLMYFYDPTRGEQRRNRVRDQFNSMIEQTDVAIDDGLHDLRNRTRGMLQEMSARLSDEESPDWIVQERVRSTIGRYVRHSGAIKTSVNQGRVTLMGSVLADEVDVLLMKLPMVRGVKGIDNQLDVHQEPGNIPSLQGEGKLYQQQGWTPGIRLLSSVGGGVLALYGLLRRGIMGRTMSVVGLGLLARGITNKDFNGMLGKSDSRQAIRVHKGIHIDAPVDQVYHFWENFENFPQFMSHLKQIRDLGNGRSHWIAKGPAGTDVEWDAIVTRQEPEREIAWESVAGSDIKTQGFVHFSPDPMGSSTHVDVQMGYTPPAGILGHAVASLFGTNPKQAMDEDLMRLKSLFETGRVPMNDQGFTGQDFSSTM